MRARYHGWTKTAIKWPNRIRSTIDAYALVGIALMLLIAFMVGTAIIPHHGLSLDLPQSRYAAPIPSAVREDAQIVSVMRDGAIYYGNTRITADDLHERIRESVRNGAERKVCIRVDARAKYRDVKLVLDEISKAGIQNVCFLAEKVSP